MSTPVTYVGNSYNIPAYQDTGYAQGTGNLSSYLIALATGSLTLSGGNFTLTSDVNFGGSFGIVALYFKSRSSNIATTGVVRLALADTISWGTSNISLSVNSSSQLAFTGGDVKLDSGKGLICTTPDGIHTYRIAIDNDGSITTEQLT